MRGYLARVKMETLKVSEFALCKFISAHVLSQLYVPCSQDVPPRLFQQVWPADIAAAMPRAELLPLTEPMSAF